MSAKSKGIIGAVIGVLAFVGVSIAQWLGYLGKPADLWYVYLFIIPLGAIIGFGLAFGFSGGVRILGGFLGVAAPVSILAIIFSEDRNRSFAMTLIILIFGISLIIGLCYIPGIIIGIR